MLGYVHFLNDRRESVRKENPDISFADISKKLAVEWGQVNEELKAEYVKRAEADKERYNKEFAAYQQTQEYKDFIKVSVNRSSQSILPTAFTQRFKVDLGLSLIKKIKLIINATFCLDRNRNPNGPTTVRIVDLPASPRK